MNPIQQGMVKAADEISCLFQHATRSFGFLPDGREMVSTAEGEAGNLVTISDRSEEGWPDVRLQIPKESEFSYATMGTLTRMATWTICETPEAILEFLMAHNAELPVPKKASSRPQWIFQIDERTKLQVAGTGRPVSGLWVTQTRTPEDWRNAVKARAEAAGTRWSGDGS